MKKKEEEEVEKRKSQLAPHVVCTKATNAFDFKEGLNNILRKSRLKKVRYSSSTRSIYMYIRIGWRVYES